MSAIGDYIHLTGKRYELYGTGQYAGEPAAAYNYNSQKDKIREKLKKNDNLTNRDKLENALNDIFNTRDKSNSSTQEIRTQVEKILRQSFGRAMGKIDWNAGNVKQRLLQGKNTTEKAIRIKNNQKTIELKTIMQKIRAIEAIRNTIKNTIQGTELTQKINQIYRDLNFIITQRKTGVIGYLKNTRDITQIKNRRLELTDNTLSLVEDINKILKTYGAAPALDIQRDDLFEYAAALAPAVARLKAGTSLEEEINKIQSQINAHNSEITTQITFDKDSFTERLDYGALNFNVSSPSANGDLSASFATTHEKTDITIDWGGQPLTASLKNVPLGVDNIQILKEYPFILFLQDEDSDFVNHFLNSVTTHVDRITPSNLTIAHETMKYTAMFKALSDSISGNNATIFIVNDTLRGKIRILDIASLMTKIENNLDNSGVVTIEGINLNAYRLKNNKEVTWEVRIAQLLNRLHSQKISVAFSPSLLK